MGEIMSAGNRSVLVVIDSRLDAERREADETVFPALEHFGMAWEVLDGGDYMGAIPEYVAPRALYVIAHDGAADWLGEEMAEQIADAVANGAGLVSFDRRPEEWPSPLRDLLPGGPGDARVAVLRFAGDGAFITFGHAEGDELEIEREIEARTLSPGDGWDPLVTDGERRVIVASCEAGDGRVVFFGCGQQIYAEGVYGHVRGIDGLMWRSMVWAAAKPFPMRCIPPYVTARMDDCNGTYGAFDYVSIMNRYGISPNLGLFIDELGPTDWAAVKRLYDSGGADFSMHAFRDDYYMARPNFKPYAILPDKPDLSNGGKQTAFEGLSLDHDTGLDLSAEKVRRNFQRMDDAFERVGIEHSRVINAHYGEIGWRAVPHFLERGADLPCNNSAIGQLYSNQPVWRPRPYGVRGPTGRHGLVIDRYPGIPDMTFISMSVSHLGSHMRLDILSGRVPYLDESDAPKLDEAAEQGIFNIRLALDSLAFGVLFTHEERINVISPDDWNSVVTSIVAGLDGWDWEGANREQVGVVCKRLFDSRLVAANRTEQGLECEISGNTGGPSPLTIWDDEGDGCSRRVVEIDAIDGFVAVNA